MQKKILNRNLIYFIILFFAVSCSSVPKYPQNACKIFGENYLWYKSTKKSSETYGAPIYIILAFINKESGFNRWAKPKRTKLFKVIPYKRPSSSLGYSQAVKKTWELYKKETNNPLAIRTRFKDSAMFIGWYIKKTNTINIYHLSSSRVLFCIGVFISVSVLFSVSLSCVSIVNILILLIEKNQRLLKALLF